MHWHRKPMRRSSGPTRPSCNPSGRRCTPWRKQNHRKATGCQYCPASTPKKKNKIKRNVAHTANDPGALRAAVQPAPRYSPMPSSEMILNRPRPRKASGFVWRLIFKTSRGRRTISPIPIKLVHQTSHQYHAAREKNRIVRDPFLPSSGGVHNCLSGPLSKRIVKVGTVVLSQVIARKWLATVLVNSLHNLLRE